MDTPDKSNRVTGFVPNPPKNLPRPTDHWEAYFDSTYLRWWDLQEQDVTVTIEKVERTVELTFRGGKKGDRPVIWFVGKKKPLVMNKTNMSSIAMQHGKQPQKWPGKKITLFPTTTMAPDPDTKKQVKTDCIRVRPKE